MWAFCSNAYPGASGDKCFALPVEEFVGDDPNEGAAHQGAALAWADQLIPTDRIKEFEEAAIEIGVALFVGRF